MLKRMGALTVVLLLFASCGTPAEGDHRIGRMILESVGEDYEVVQPPASGPLNLDAAASATSAGGSRLRRQLSTTGFQEGYSRVWRQTNDDFIAILAFQFLTEARAENLVEFMALEHEDKRSAQRFSVPRIPGSVGYILNARIPGAQTSLFCHMVWFPHDNVTFEVRVCTPQPGSAEPAIELALEQYRKAGGRPLSPDEVEAPEEEAPPPPPEDDEAPEDEAATE